MSTNQSLYQRSEEPLSLGLLQGSMARLHISLSDSDSISLSSLFEPDGELALQDDGFVYEEEEDVGIVSNLARTTLTDNEIVEWQQRIVAELEADHHVHHPVHRRNTRRAPHPFQSNAAVYPTRPVCWIGLSYGSSHTGILQRRFGMVPGMSTPHIISPYMELVLPQTHRPRRTPLGLLNISNNLAQSDPWDDPHYSPEMGRRSALFYPDTHILVP